MQNDKKVIIYTLPNCPQCKELKKELKKKKIKFSEKDMGSPESRTTLLMNNVFTLEAPVLQCGKRFYYGNDLSDEEGIDGVLAVLDVL